MTLTMTLFGWRWPDDDFQRAGLRELQMPALARLWGRAQRLPALALADYDSWLAATAGVDTVSALPEAQLLHSDDPVLATLPEGGYLLCADPVELDLRSNQVVISPAGDLDQAEQDALLASLNHHFAADNWRFVQTTTGRWLVWMPAEPQVAFTPLRTASGRSLQDVAPQGADALRWSALLNEIQMLLYAHPVNDARSEAGRALIQGVWFSGCASRTQALELPARSDALYTDDALLGAIWRAGSGKVLDSKACPIDAQQVVLQRAQTLVRQGDTAGWLAYWQDMEARWFTPLLQTPGIELQLVLPELGLARRYHARSSLAFWRAARLPGAGK